ncbi:hypothetical protein TNIN_155381 [Trichonephila inaurata madagascariensis]|uniref:Uncharacterized protein n=1 Tax=Trichonephila inaurata madagascariensis TaxID=2747483 RepID=A0A8X7CRD0_9ARAC|nr:hypothetical protein TNIN_155381 [Trichonephila inaurata madagascariensis]
MTESSHRKRTMANDQHRSQASLSFDKGTGMHTPLPGVFSRQGDRPSELCAVLHSIEADHPGSSFKKITEPIFSLRRVHWSMGRGCKFAL